MSKIDFNKKTKLDNIHENSQEKLDIIVRKEAEVQNKSFRFKSGDLQRLRAILEKTNNASQSTRFKETDIIRGLLALGADTPGEKIISFIRKSI
jgi:hypothetical protein